MRFSDNDVRQFAEWSRDRNPLHVDPVHAKETHFGRPIVHGMLTVVESLAAARGITEPQPITSLDIEFRGAVVAGGAYEVDARPEGEDLLVTLRNSEGVVLTVRQGSGAAVEDTNVDLSWVAPLAGLQPAGATAPAIRTIEELQRGIVATGVYDVAPPPLSQPTWSAVPRLQARVLTLCSYLVGMEIPGLRSLFTKATIRFHVGPHDVPELRYRVRTVRFDRHFRLLESEVHVAAPDGTLVATARLRSYVPFSPVVTDVSELVSRLGTSTASLRGKVALVCGASRGLGADVAATLAGAGCHVYAAARSEQSPVTGVADWGGRLESVRGDVGDAEWCRALLETIRATHGRLDILVLNACEPPTTLRIGSDSFARQDEYLRANLRLVQTPLSTFLSTLDAHRGCVAYISSSAVDQPVAGWSHYVALKQAAEGLVRTAAEESGRILALIARPPALQTRWSDIRRGLPKPSLPIGSHPIS